MKWLTGCPVGTPIWWNPVSEPQLRRGSRPLSKQSMAKATNVYRHKEAKTIKHILDHVLIAGSPPKRQKYTSTANNHDVLLQQVHGLQDVSFVVLHLEAFMLHRTVAPQNGRRSWNASSPSIVGTSTAEVVVICAVLVVDGTWRNSEHQLLF